MWTLYERGHPLAAVSIPGGRFFIGILESDSRATRESDDLQQIMAVGIMGIELLLAKRGCGGHGRFIPVL